MGEQSKSNNGITQNKNPDISVIIATHNRAAVLNKTLGDLLQLDRTGINAEFIVIDNNSTDNTKQVIEQFSECLPIRYLFEPQPGQNSARNRALAEGPLGRIIAFTDDDVVPNSDWLKEMILTSRKWPQYSVFGGKIYIIWPQIKIPEWAKMPTVRGLCFAEHGCQQVEGEYPPHKFPFSGNFWVRSEVFDNGRKFDEAISWQPKNRILATETVFFQKLSKEGYEFLFSPHSVVGHRITKEQVTLTYLCKRAYSGGRAISYMRPLCRRKLFDKCPRLWCFIRIGAIVLLGFRLAASLVLLTFKRVEKTIYVIRWLGYNFELLKNAKKDTNV